MWKRFRKRVDNWIFEEVDDEEEKNQQEINEHEKYKDRSNTPDAKMVYKYPKQAPFRFPIIQDETEINAVENTDIPAYKRRKSHRVNNYVRREDKDSSIGLHKIRNRKQDDMKQLQDVPAYLRRKRVEQQQIEETEQYEEDVIEHEAPQSEVIPHTTPDELDAVFRKRDMKKADHEQKISQGKKRHETNENQYNYNSYDNQTKTEQNNIDETITNPIKEQEILCTVHEQQRKTINQKQNDLIPKSEPKQTEVSVIRETKQKLRNTSSNTYHVTESIKQETNQESSVTSPLCDEIVQDVPYYLLNDPVEANRTEDERWLNEQTYLLEQTLKHFNVKADVVNVTQGSSVTRFEVRPHIGVKVSRIRNLIDDIKLNMAAKDIRIEAPIPGRHTVGIEVPNKHAYPVGLQEIIQTDVFNETDSPLTIALGLTIEGEPLVTTVGKMPHCLIAGATGSGKSVCINTILLSLMYKASYDDVKFLLIDPKMVELAPYNSIPYLISPVITDVKAATASLKWAVSEMERRYELFAASRVRDIARYNTRIESGKITGEKMPYIVIVIDELADLMMASPQDVEDAICRIAQKARACGIHLLLATQRPSVDVITGLIKANIPTRISFSVTSQVDSRTIIDTNGAEKLLGKGDMLFVENGSSEIVRLQGPFVSDDEIERVTAYTRSLAEPTYLFEQDQLLQEIVEDETEDELLDDVIQFIIEHDQISTSLLQRRFRIGYNRAARLIDTLESRGIISGQNGTKPRDVLMTQSQLEQL